MKSFYKISLLLFTRAPQSQSMNQVVSSSNPQNLQSKLLAVPVLYLWNYFSMRNKILPFCSSLAVHSLENSAQMKTLTCLQTFSLINASLLFSSSHSWKCTFICASDFHRWFRVHDWLFRFQPCQIACHLATLDFPRCRNPRQLHSPVHRKAI